MNVRIVDRGSVVPGSVPVILMGAISLLTGSAPWVLAGEMFTASPGGPTKASGEAVGESRGETVPEPPLDLVRPSRLTSGGSMPRLRPLTEGAKKLLDRGARRSSIVAELQKQIEASDLVVYITDEMARPPGGPLAHTVFLSDGGETRYLLIRIDPWRAALTNQIATLGHELQHALEIAAAPEVRDSGGLEPLYRRIGWEAGKGQYESEAARAIGRLIQRQMARGGA